MSRPTMVDVAKRAKVSRALVSLVMNEPQRVSEAKRQAVLQAAQELGYRPNLVARQLAQRRTRTLGVLVDDLRNPFFGEVVDGVETEAALHGFRILILNGHRDCDRELSALETFLQFRVEGLVLVGPRIGDDDLLRIDASTPCVVVASGLAPPGVDMVVTDGHVGAELAVQHLVGLGHRRIVHIDGAANASAPERRCGYRRAMETAGLADMIDVRAGGDDEAAAVGVIDELLAEPEMPTAVFAFNDLLAAGALDRFDDAGLSVPGDVSIVGFDNTFISGLRHLSLTTINQPTVDMGRLAVETLLKRANEDPARSVTGDAPGVVEPIRHTLQPTLVIRSTTAPPTSSSHPQSAALGA